MITVKLHEHLPRRCDHCGDAGRLLLIEQTPPPSVTNTPEFKRDPFTYQRFLCISCSKDLHDLLRDFFL